MASDQRVDREDGDSDLLHETKQPQLAECRVRPLANRAGGIREHLLSDLHRGPRAPDPIDPQRAPGDRARLVT